MFARLKRYIYALMSALALWAVLLAILPAVAKAHETAPTNDTQGTDRYADSAERIVVSPGDSLWSISTQRLGPSATAQQIAITVERIYSLNRDRISDPDLIFPGQKLLLPPAGKPTETGPTARAAYGERAQASRTTVGEADGEAGKASGPVVEPVADLATLPALPEEVAATPVPAVTSLTLDDAPRPAPASFLRNALSEVSSSVTALAEPFTEGRYDRRQLLGLGILVLTWGAAIGAAIIVARRLYVRAHTRRQDQDQWFREAYGKNYASREVPADSRYTPSTAPGALELEQDSERSFDDSGGEAATVKNGSHQVKTIAWARGRRNRLRRRMRVPRQRRRSPQQGRAATGAHSPKIRRRLRRPHGLRPRGKPRGMMLALKQRGGGG